MSTQTTESRADPDISGTPIIRSLEMFTSPQLTTDLLATTENERPHPTTGVSISSNKGLSTTTEDNISTYVDFQSKTITDIMQPSSSSRSKQDLTISNTISMLNVLSTSEIPLATDETSSSMSFRPSNEPMVTSRSLTTDETRSVMSEVITTQSELTSTNNIGEIMSTTNSTWSTNAEASKIHETLSNLPSKETTTQVTASWASSIRTHQSNISSTPVMANMSTVSSMSENSRTQEITTIVTGAKATASFSTNIMPNTSKTTFSNHTLTSKVTMNQPIKPKDGNQDSLQADNSPKAGEIINISSTKPSGNI